MPFIYEDSFQEDEDLCHILSAIRLGNAPEPLAIPVTRLALPNRLIPVVDEGDEYISPDDPCLWIDRNLPTAVQCIPGNSSNARPDLALAATTEREDGAISACYQ